MKLNQIVSNIQTTLYNKGEYGANTPSERDIFYYIEKAVILHGVKRVNGNGILRQTIKVMKSLQSAK